MMQWILDNIFTIISTVFGGTSIVALFLEKNKRRIQEKQLSADALTKMQEAYAIFTNDSTLRYNDLKEEMERELTKLKTKVDEIAKELLLEKNTSQKFSLENSVLKKENEILQKELTECKEKL